MYEAGRIRVEQESHPTTTVKASDINVGNGCLDYHYGLLIRVGFNVNVLSDEVPSSQLPFLSLALAQIVFIETNTGVVRKDIKVVVEN